MFCEAAFSDSPADPLSSAFQVTLHEIFVSMVKFQQSHWKCAFLMGLSKSAAARDSSAQALTRSTIFDRKLLGLLFSFVDDDKTVSLYAPTVAMHLRMCGTPKSEVPALTNSIMSQHGRGQKSKLGLTFAGFKLHYQRALETKPEDVLRSMVALGYRSDLSRNSTLQWELEQSKAAIAQEWKSQVLHEESELWQTVSLHRPRQNGGHLGVQSFFGMRAAADRVVHQILDVLRAKSLAGWSSACVMFASCTVKKDTISLRVHVLVDKESTLFLFEEENVAQVIEGLKAVDVDAEVTRQVHYKILPVFRSHLPEPP